LPGTEGTLRVATPKPHKSVAYEAAVKSAMDEPKEGATTLKKKAQEKLAAKANPVEEAPVAEVSEPVAVAEVSEPVAVAEVSEVPAEVTEIDAVVETPAEEEAK
jgi:small subunit ribosomal protein S16